MVKNNLFELVKTMNSAEKRLFKLKAFTYNNKNDVNVQLFDIYVAAKTLEDLNKMILKKIKSKRITKLHSELYQLLQVFFAEEEIKTERKYQLYQKIFTAKSFLKRKLYNQADQILEKVLKEVFKYEMYEIAFEALAVKVELSAHTAKLKGSEVYREGLLKELELTTERIYGIYSRFIVYSQLIDELEIRGPIRNKKELDYYKNLTKKINLNEGEGFRVKRNNIVIESEFKSLVQDQGGILETRKSLIALYADYEHMIKLYVIDYTIAHYNLAGELIEIDQLEEAGNIIEEIELMLHKYKKVSFLEIDFLGLCLELNIRKRDLSKSFQLANKLVEMKRDDGSIVYDNYIAVKVTVAYFLAREYQLALDSINLALDNRMKTQRKDCYSLLLMYEIIIYTRLEWNNMAESKLLGLIRYLKLYYNKGSFENWCVGFLRKLIKGNESSYKETIRFARETIEEINEEDLSDHILGLGEFRIWFEYELSN